VSALKLCPTCGTEYPASERFCPRDGTALRAQGGANDLVGSVVAERYHVIKKLGEGGMGQVYLAEHVKMGRKSALKVMNPGMASDADAIARFNREAANASRLNHPNICAIYDFGETPDGLIYLAMEFIEGQALTDLMKQGPLAPPRAASILHQAADALQVAHDHGIVHRDIKPDNIMIAKGREGADLVKVVDFGIARAHTSEAQKVTKTGLVVGTPEYMSPEQLAGDKLDGRSDIYALALVAFNMLTGRLPFVANSAQEAMIARLTDQPKTLAEMQPAQAWPDALQAVMDRALARDATERYQSAAQFGREFAAAIADMPITAAVEAGTMVVGAAAVAKAAADRTAAVPATRVASAGRGAPAATAPAAVTPRKGNGAVIGAAVGGVAVLAVAAYLMVLKPGSDAPADAGADSAQVVTVPPAPTDSAAAPAPFKTPTDAGTRPTAPDRTPTDPRPNPPPGPSLLEQLRALDAAVNDEARAAAALSTLRGLAERAGPDELPLALYLQGIAHGTLGNQGETCQLLGRAKASGLRGPQLERANTIISQACP
jgi:serine/threonine-protein kinase